MTASARVEQQLGQFVNAHWQLEVAAGLADDRLDFPEQAFAERYVAIELMGQWRLR